jgi:acetoin utilization protein AcuB
MTAPPRVWRWMSTPAATIDADALVRGAAELMRSRRLRHLPVVDRGQRLVGIVTDRDLRHVIFSPAVRQRLGALADVLKALRVSDVMTRAVVTVRRDTPLADAAALMHERRIGALPVVERERVVGILTETDVLDAFRRLLRYRGAAGKRGPRRPRPRSRARYDFGFPLSAPGDPWQDEGGGD